MIEQIMRIFEKKQNETNFLKIENDPLSERYHHILNLNVYALKLSDIWARLGPLYNEVGVVLMGCFTGIHGLVDIVRSDYLGWTKDPHLSQEYIQTFLRRHETKKEKEKEKEPVPVSKVLKKGKSKGGRQNLWSESDDVDIVTDYCSSGESYEDEDEEEVDPE